MKFEYQNWTAAPFLPLSPRQLDSDAPELHGRAGLWRSHDVSYTIKAPGAHHVVPRRHAPHWDGAPQEVRPRRCWWLCLEVFFQVFSVIKFLCESFSVLIMKSYSCFFSRFFSKFGNETFPYLYSKKTHYYKTEFLIILNKTFLTKSFSRQQKNILSFSLISRRQDSTTFIGSA